MKRAITLIEVLIAFALTAILLATLMGTLTRTVKVQKNLSTAKAIITKRASLHQRLSYVFAHSKDFKFVDNTLEMTLQNGYDHDPIYRGECAVVIRHNPKSDTLELFFDKDRKVDKPRTEDLCSCKRIEWEFFPDETDKQWITLTIDGTTKYPFYVTSPSKGRELL